MNEVFIIGGGPSCRHFDFSLLSKKETIGCNNSAKAADTKYLFSMDRTWINYYSQDVLNYADRAHLSICHSVYREKFPQAHIYTRTRQGLISMDKDYIHGGNSGHGAINLAVQMGFTTIHLLGFDFSELGHWHGGYTFGSQKSQWMMRWAEDIDKCKPILDNMDVEVINWNLNSGLQAYQKKDINLLKEYLCETP